MGLDKSQRGEASVQQLFVKFCKKPLKRNAEAKGAFKENDSPVNTTEIFGRNRDS